MRVRVKKKTSRYQTGSEGENENKYLREINGSLVEAVFNMLFELVSKTLKLIRVIFVELELKIDFGGDRIKECTAFGNAEMEAFFGVRF